MHLNCMRQVIQSRPQFQYLVGRLYFWTFYRVKKEDFHPFYFFSAFCSYLHVIDHFPNDFNRSVLGRAPTAYTRFGQSERHAPPAPIRTLRRSSRLSCQRRLLFTNLRITPKHAVLMQNHVRG